MPQRRVQDLFRFPTRNLSMLRQAPMQPTLLLNTIIRVGYHSMSQFDWTIMVESVPQAIWQASTAQLRLARQFFACCIRLLSSTKHHRDTNGNLQEARYRGILPLGFKGNNSTMTTYTRPDSKQCRAPRTVRSSDMTYSVQGGVNSPTTFAPYGLHP